MEPVNDTALAAAQLAQLWYWQDQSWAIARVRCGRGFRYLNAQGRPIRDEHILARVRRLVIPPAWTSVRICPHERGHLQAIGRDARGRKQYRYHERWRSVRDEAKYDRLLEFAEALPQIRQRVHHDLRRLGMPRAKVLAAVVRLLEATLIRIGNETYVRQNHSFGLTTLRNKHVHVHRSELFFEFRGKSGVLHRVTVDDARLARIVKRCQDIPGQDLFQYLDDHGRRHPIGSDDVNGYLRETVGNGFTAKDFRTWGATLLAARALCELPTATSKTSAVRYVARAVEGVAQCLRNTAAVCRKCYIHSGLIASYLNGTLAQGLRLPSESAKAHSGTKLAPDEIALVAWLRRGRRAQRTG